MDEPDYSQYTQAQLRQVLSGIDGARFPQRQREIETRLAAMSDAPAAVAQDTLPPSEPAPASIASLWRRAGAFCLDMLLLCIIGMIAGAFFHDQFAALGARGKLVGLLVTLAYFTITESRLGGGQSLGMKALGVRVVSRSGEALGVPAALLRCAIYFLAYFTSAADFGLANVWFSTGLSLLGGVLAFSIFYMLIFNRKTRQSIHDLAVGAFVVRAVPGQAGPSVRTIWRGHAAILGAAILVLLCGGGLISWKILKASSFSSLMPMYQAIRDLPGVERAEVQFMFPLADKGGAGRLFIHAFVKSPNGDPDTLARRIARAALDNSALASRQQAIVIILSSGYDIGIAWSLDARNYNYTPAQWRADLNAPAP